MILAGIFLGTSVHAVELEVKIPTLTVRGQASLYKPANELHLNLGVVTQGQTAEEVLKENNTTMHKIIESIEIVGLRDSEYQTGQFSVDPIYSQRPKLPPPNWQPQIVGYRVTNTIAIKTEKIKLAGELIDNAAGAGANRIDNLWFGLKDFRLYRAEAITEAATNATVDARTLSKAMHVVLQKILSVSLDDACSIVGTPKGPTFVRAMLGESAPIQRGDIEIRASVTIVYEIE